MTDQPATPRDLERVSQSVTPANSGGGALAGDSRAAVEDFRRRHQTSLVTLLFTDLVGSTKLKQDKGDKEGVALIQAHAKLVREILRSIPDAQEISTAGDAFFCVFVRPSDAVAFALKAQAAMRSMFRSGRPGDGPALAMRLGVHLGEVVIEQREDRNKPLDLFGLQVDIAARVMSLAEGGQILCTRAVFDNARQVLKGRELGDLAPLVWLNHGSYLMKGVEDPIEVCEVGEEGLGVLRPPTASEKARPSGVSEEELGWRPAPDGKVPGTEWFLEAKLGEGGFGEVWRATHRRTKDRRIFKFCFLRARSKSLRRELALFRLIREQVGEHPNIVRLYEVFLEEPPYYLGMEYVPGRNLREWCVEGHRLRKLPTQAKLDIVAQVADALAAAHKAGVIHQDLKPQNILVDETAPCTASGAPKVKLSDFGVGRVVNEEALGKIALTGGGATLLRTTGSASESGTMLYMAPERIEGRPATPQSDLYSLGIVLFQLVVGDLDRAVTPDWETEVADPVVRADLRLLLAGKPESRVGSASTFAARLRSWSGRRRRRTLAAVALVAAGMLLAAGGTAAFFSHRLSTSRREAQESRARAEREAGLRAAAEASEKKATDALSDVFVYRGDAYVAQHNHLHAMLCLAKARELAPLLRTEVASFAIPWPRATLADARHYDCRATCLAVSRGGETDRIACGFADGTVRLWEETISRDPSVIPAHGGAVASLAFSVDGAMLASAGADKIVKVWDTRSKKEICAFQGHQDAVRSVAFSRNNILASGSADRTVRLWDIAQKKELIALARHDGEVASVAFSPDGKVVASAGRDRTVRLWDAEKWLEIQAINAHEKWLTAVAFSPDGRMLATGSRDNTLKLWNTANGEEICAIYGHQNWINSVAFSPDGKMLVSASEDDSARLFEVPSGEELFTLVGHNGDVADARFTADGRTLVTAGDDGAIKLWAVLDPRLFQPLSGHSGWANCLAFSRDGNMLVSGGEDNTARLWAVREGGGGKELSVLKGHEDDVLSVAFSPDGKTVATGGKDRTARLWSVPDGVAICTLVKSADEVDVVAFSPDGGKIAAATGDATITIWTVEDRKEICRMKGHGDSIGTMAFSPDGKLLAASGGADFLVRMWDAATGKEAGSLAGHRDSVSALAFSPDGSELVSGSDDCTLRIWGVAEKKERMTLVGHQDSVLSVAYYPHGRIIFSGGFDNLLKFWDAATGKELRSLPGLKEEVVSAALSPDGWAIATGNWDDTIKLWRSWLPFTMEDVELMSGCTVYGSDIAPLSAEREQELLEKARNPARKTGH
ncbi:MAG: protein kinase [Planctomycetota bacterium]|nr:protein kinase [Planctomycetota bacterium]